MSTTFKYILDKRRPTKKGYYLIRLRIFQDRIFKEFSSTIAIPEGFWDELKEEILPGYPDADILDTILYNHKSRVRKFLQIRELEDKPYPTLTCTAKKELMNISKSSWVSKTL